LKDESTALQSRIEAIPELREVFCHNDLLIYNIIHDEKKGLSSLDPLPG
jgi:thiamine kinase-like enzyme